ncbi:uncharacterized protein [Triticum aestivum]|uniref:uncharacterized protein n=1 Tax=Triticum aestivum TaxID=4565 RepID=UPI001D029A63|nr:uncharacterized protein LOC123163136 [Triticum aestivum]
MPDPVTASAAVGWGVSAAGWLISPIISRVLNKGFAHLDFDAAEKLKMLDVQVLQLQRLMEVADESTYKVQDGKSDGSTMDSLKKNLRSAMPSCLLKDKKSGKTKVELKKSLESIESAISDACNLLKQLKLTALSSDNGRPVVAANSHHAVTTGGPPPRVIGTSRKRVIREAQ